MKIIGKKKLLENALFDEDREAREVALNILESALVSVDPRVVIRNHVRRRGNLLFIDNLTFNLEEFERVFVIGGGKASGAMAEAMEEIIGDKISRGIINVLRGTSFKTRKILINEAGHPIPDEAGVKGAKKIVQLAREAEENDLVICLISGGGSALMPLSADGVSLHEKQRLTQELLRCGAAINEINAVRKHISAIKGGQLAKVAYPATVVSLILSDVVGDPLDTIASGPTAPDTTTFADAVSILKKYGLWEVAPDSIRRRLEAGLRGEVAETPKPGDKIFERTYNIIIGNNRTAAMAAYMKAESLGFNVLLLSTMIEGEARHVGTAYAGIIKEILASGNPIRRPAVVIAGGETTVTVMGGGKGGRNQELVLAAALKISGLKGIAIASIDTDGLDGSTEAAGAIVDGQTIMRANKIGLDPRVCLANNNSYDYFSRLKDLIFTGPTGTNVNDITVIVIV